MIIFNQNFYPNFEQVVKRSSKSDRNLVKVIPSEGKTFGFVTAEKIKLVNFLTHAIVWPRNGPSGKFMHALASLVDPVKRLSISTNRIEQVPMPRGIKAAKAGEKRWLFSVRLSCGVPEV